jgi:hypothetical protein
LQTFESSGGIWKSDLVPDRDVVGRADGACEASEGMAVGVRGTAAAGEPSEASSVLVKPDDKVVVLISIRDPDAETGVGYAWAAREGAGGVLRSAEGRPKPSSSISIELEAVSCLTMSSEMDESVERRTRFALGGVSLSTTTSSPSTSLFKP